MKILDRYIIRQFLMNFFIMTFVLMALMILVDIILDIDEFLEVGRVLKPQFGSAWLALAWAVYEYYHPLMVLTYCFMSSLIVAGAMGFTFVSLSRSGEIVATLASGISLYRVAAPILLTGFLLGSLTLPLEEYVLPNLVHKLARRKTDLRRKGYRTFPVGFTADDNGSLLSAQEFDPVARTLDAPIILVRDSKRGGLTTQRVTATRGIWNEALGGWDLTNGQAITRQAGAVAPVAPAMIAFYPSNLTPDVLRAQRQALFARLLSISELHSLSLNPAADAVSITQIIHSRFSRLAINLLIMIMTLPFFLMRTPGNMMRQGMYATAVSIAAWAGALVIMQFGVQWEPLSSTTSALPGGVVSLVNMVGEMLSRPVTSAWLPVVVFLPLSAWMLMRVRT